MSAKRKRILVCPLDWGIGHASRCIPIIRLLQTMGHEVLIAANGGGKALLMKYFPDAYFIELPAVTVKYSRGRWLGWKLLTQMPRFVLGIFRENKALQQVVKKYRIDGIISDNRFGCWSNKISSVYITHQINLVSPVLRALTSPILTHLHHWIIRQYSECWIPDLPGESRFALAGMLSHPPTKKVKSIYIGLLSRFEKPANQNRIDGNYVLAILSGPEPQRSLLEKKIVNELGNRPLKIIRGLPDSIEDFPSSDKIEWFNHADDLLFEKLVSAASVIICRSGYSTLMDLVTLGRSAHLIPTPGQTEQEYLALHLNKAGLFSTQRQNEKIELPEMSNYSVEFQNFTILKDRLFSTLEEWLTSL